MIAFINGLGSARAIPLWRSRGPNDSYSSWQDLRPHPVQSLSGLGVTSSAPLGALGCKELNVVTDRIGVALAAAETAGVPVNGSAYQAAKAFFDREDGFFSSTWYVGAESCANLVASGNAVLAALNADIAAAGGQSVAISTPKLEEPADITGTIKTVAIAAGVIAVAFMAVPIITEVVAAVKLGRKK